MTDSALVDELTERGFVAIRGAVSPDIVRECVAAIEESVRKEGVDLHDRATWSRPVVRVVCPSGPAFTAAGASPALREAYDALLGPGRWVQRDGVGGTVPVRFPSDTNPGDAGWHIDGSYSVGDEYWVNVHSRGRGLLALFHFSDIGEDDAPTQILVGSHHDVPRVVASYGDAGASFGTVTAGLPRSTFERPRASATGYAGDVYLCHPFLVHRATWPHRGTRPRMLAQPAIDIREPFALQSVESACAVERVIIEALAQTE